MTLQQIVPAADCRADTPETEIQLHTLRVRESASLSTMKLLKKPPMEASTALAHMSLRRESTDPMGPIGGCLNCLGFCLILLRSWMTASPPKAFMGVSAHSPWLLADTMQAFDTYCSLQQSPASLDLEALGGCKRAACHASVRSGAKSKHKRA